MRQMSFQAEGGDQSQPVAQAAGFPVERIRYTIEVWEDEVLPVLLSDVPDAVKRSLLSIVMSMNETLEETIERWRRERERRA